MRQWVAILCLIGLLAYVGMVLDHAQASDTGDLGLSGLNRAMVRAGGDLNAVSFILTAPITDPALPLRLQERLARQIGPVKLAEQPDARLRTRDGLYYLEIRWRLTGTATDHWEELYQTLTAALAAEGVTEATHIQLEGMAAGLSTDLLGLANRALDSLGARDRQPWHEGPSASVAGRTAQLPSGPHEVNVQVAARQMSQGVRLFVAWPAMVGDY